jgi:two-component system cell cycle sensor histidine kinase/response regulator CckA
MAHATYSGSRERILQQFHWGRLRLLTSADALLSRVGKAGLVSALVVFTLGFLLLAFDSRVSRVLTRASYDWSFGLTRFARPDISASKVVIVYIDEDSLKALGQPLNLPMDRTLHARLLDRLTAEGAKAVVMDIVFSDPGPDKNADDQFAGAIGSNGRVILGADYTPGEALNSVAFKSITPVYAPFARVANRVGLVVLQPDSDFLVRQHFHHLPEIPGAPPSLSWSAAELVGLKSTQDKRAGQTKRWIYYYGPPETIPYVSYKQALSADGVAPGFFKGKVVFIGGRPMTSSLIEKRDELRNPYPSANKEFIFMPMVEVHATQFLNLQRRDWLTRPTPLEETFLVAFAALLFGFGLLRFRPLVATTVAIAGSLAVVLLAQTLFAAQHIWFAWLVVVAVQIPSALLCSVVFRSLEWIAQRRKLEEERRRDHERIREQAALLDKAHDAIMVHDLSWRVQYWNKSAEVLYGWTFEEIKNKDLRREVLGLSGSQSLDSLQIVLAKGEWLGEMKQLSRSGKKLIVQSRWTLVRDGVGNPQSVLVINTDVTEQKQLEAQFLRTQRMESIGTLAGGIAHDLNNVLSPIIMGVELLKLKVPDDSSRTMLASMANSAKRGSDMVKQVLSFARGHDGERTPVQIGHLVREMQKIVKETFPKNIDFQALAEKAKPILGDATQMHQILLNLCVNARDAMPNGGRIVVSIKDACLSQPEAEKFVGAKPIPYVLLSVTDTGTGIPPEIIDRIFEPFFTTKEIGKGTGLGLSTVIGIIKSHGGFLDLQTEVGKGTAFNVYLPAAESSATTVTSTALAPELWGKGETIMVVDDEPAILDLAQGLLTHYGYKVVTAAHGADALALYAQYKEKIQVVLMDMMMPVMDGPTAIRALRQQQSDLKVVAISGLMQSDSIKTRLGDPAIPFLPKPFTTEKLLEQIRKLILPVAT